jgi:pimeloyl-ACP methyl ester carboxylesterase
VPLPEASSTARLPLQAASDLRGLARLGIDGVLGITDLVEAMHHTIASRTAIAGAAPVGRTRGITGFVYRAVRGTTRLVGHAGDALFGVMPSHKAASNALRHPTREALLAALNGVWGDHLADSGNPLAISMTLRRGPPDRAPGATAIAPATIATATAITASATANDASDAAPVSGRVLVLVHGLCMNDLQWQRHGHDHGTALAQALGCTPLYLHYNSGRHISSNGRDFADLLERTLAHWPVPVRELSIVGHSMGGLVARSACHHAQQRGLAWLPHLKNLAFLGTPHHGAPLERGGHLLDTMFGLSPYVAPFTRLTGSRSAGITDLRHGNLQDADWQGDVTGEQGSTNGPHGDTTNAQTRTESAQGRATPRRRRDEGRPTPLPPGVHVGVVAATLARDPCSRRGRMLGDGLVPLASALGGHSDPALALALPASQQLVVPEASHWDLLDRPEVAAQLVRWLQR